MTRAKLTFLSVCILLATTPFLTNDTTRTLGLPLWSVYVLAASLLYATAITAFLGRYWQLMAQDPKNQSDLAGEDTA